MRQAVDDAVPNFLFPRTPGNKTGLFELVLRICSDCLRCLWHGSGVAAGGHRLSSAGADGECSLFEKVFSAMIAIDR